MRSARVRSPANAPEGRMPAHGMRDSALPHTARHLRPGAKSILWRHGPRRVPRMSYAAGQRHGLPFQLER
jgi:hypothetical protein